MPWNALTSGLAMLLLASGVARAGDPTQFFDVGPFIQVQQTKSDPFDVSADGAFVVGDNRSSGISEGFRWSATLGYEPLPPIVPGVSGAYACSQDGQVVVGIATSNLTLFGEAFRWTPSGGTLGLGSAGCVSNSRAYDVTDDGTLAAGTLSGNGCGNTSFYWSETTGIQVIPGMGVKAVAGGGSAPPPAPEPPGDFARLAGQDGATGEVSIWTPAGGVQSLGFPGDVTRMTPDGSVMVGASLNVAYRWTFPGTLESLGTLGGGGSVATGVSADGSRVVGWSATGPGDPGTPFQPFLWDAEHGIRDLQTVLTDEYGLDLDDWNLRDALGISADGRTITGTGQSSSGHRIWVVKLGDPVGTWNDLGNALQGTVGAPTLQGEGTLQAGTTISFALSDALPSALAYFVLGLSELSAPFKGGVLVPSPDLLVTLNTGAGSVGFGFPAPAGIPQGLVLYFQCWISDPGGPVGLAATNALAAVAP